MNKETKIINPENFTNKTNQYENQQNKSNLKIINGNDTTEYMRNKYNFFCSITTITSSIPYSGGSYIGKNIVLTAAHVVYNSNINNIKVRFNKKNLYDNGLSYTVKKILIHPNYNTETLDNDIALIFLDKNPINDRIKFVYLPSERLSKKLYINGKLSIIMGYGTTISEEVNQPFNQKYALINILDKNKVEFPSEWITENMIVAGDYNDPDDPNDNEDTCQGDSGGPLFGNYGYKRSTVIFGITSWGVGCGLDNLPGVYTKVGNYTNWIYQNWNYDKLEL